MNISSTVVQDFYTYSEVLCKNHMTGYPDTFMDQVKHVADYTAVLVSMFPLAKIYQTIALTSCQGKEELRGDDRCAKLKKAANG